MLQLSQGRVWTLLPPKGGGFIYGWSRIDQPAADCCRYSTVKLSSGSGGRWFAIYSFHTSSVTLPLVATQYPRAHRCWPQYLFLNSLYSLNSLCELFPFRYCTAFDTDRFGGIDISICTWSRFTEPAYICISLLLEISRSSSRHRKPTSPPSTACRYFVDHTKWYLQSHTEWLLRL